ncbi:hypothetical protein AsAng_0056550 [Aureispira anguillae]|uniref:Uncharacterized protein n=1 Tax=Aureispira anguillae TaxID=2864201 RepID=A0A915YKP9_9BACT|nr:hypothetical protein AsAng_0056550 [Aureispira anguillae]
MLLKHSRILQIKNKKPNNQATVSLLIKIKKTFIFSTVSSLKYFFAFFFPKLKALFCSLSPN